MRHNRKRFETRSKLNYLLVCWATIHAWRQKLKDAICVVEICMVFARAKVGGCWGWYLSSCSGHKFQESLLIVSSGENWLTLWHRCSKSPYDVVSYVEYLTYGTQNLWQWMRIEVNQFLLLSVRIHYRLQPLEDDSLRLQSNSIVVFGVCSNDSRFAQHKGHESNRCRWLFG